MKPPAAIFDLDGTLVHTAPDLVESLNHALAEAGYKPAEYAELAPFAGTGGRGMLKHYCQLRSLSLTEQQILPLIASFMGHYNETMPGQAAAYDGAWHLVSALQQAGFKTAICTNKPQLLAEKLITKLGTRQLFDAICGADYFSFKKPDPRHLIETIKLAGGDVQRSVMFGDSQTDFDTAAAANCPMIGVTFGYSPEPISNFKLSKTISSFHQMNVASVEALIAMQR